MKKWTDPAQRSTEMRGQVAGMQAALLSKSKAADVAVVVSAALQSVRADQPYQQELPRIAETGDDSAE